MRLESNSKSKSKFNFSIWDLVICTTFVSVLFAIPVEALKFLVGASIYAIIMLSLLSVITIFARPKIKARSANAERFLLNMLLRGFVFSTLVLVGALVAIGLHLMGGNV